MNNFKDESNLKVSQESLDEMEVQVKAFRAWLAGDDDAFKKAGLSRSERTGSRKPTWLASSIGAPHATRYQGQGESSHSSRGEQ